MTKSIDFGSEGREKLLKGVDTLSNAVKSTLGAKGKNVIIGTDFGLPIITKDGVTVAKAILLQDEVENMGAALVKEVAAKTAEVAGDGTTSSVVLAQAILTEGINAVNNGANQIFLKYGLDKAAKCVVAELKKIAKPVKGSKQLINIASISANNDPEIGKLIGEAVSFVGVDGIIHIEESGTMRTTAEKVDGLMFKQGYIDKHFVKGNKDKIELTEVSILMYDKKISSMGEIIPILDQVHKAKRSLVIIAEDVEGEALKSLIVNNMQGTIAVCCVKTPGYGSNRYDMMNDIAIKTGGTFLSEDLGVKLTEHNIKNMGYAEKVTITKDKTIIIGGNVDADVLESRVKDLKEMIEQPLDHDVKFLKHRLANLTNGVSSIRVGGATEVEVKEKIDRIDDALNATISSMEEGYVAGGGVAFIRCLDALDELKMENEDERIGKEIIFRSIQAPFFQILENGGMNGVDFVQIIRNEAYGVGVDIKTGETRDLIKAGIIDPVKVSRVALENSVSIAGTFLTTDCIILNISEEY